MGKSELSPDTWKLVCKLFDRLAHLPPEQRALHRLDHAGPLVETLKQMLAAHDATDPKLLDQTIHAIAGRLIGSSIHQVEPIDHRYQRFGPWRALEEIGRGGMGVVLKGERADGQFEKVVAIKLLPQADAGFEQQRLLEEIRILARLEHPNIARLIDGGISDKGTPYLVMEYVNGQPIVEYCDSHNLDAAARIRLLKQAIDAVGYAHRHLVVHCDLKPANILVSDEGLVKLVDFGIATLISTGSQTLSEVRGLLCTPGYSAPEQMRGEPAAVPQDVFSLGAVLYQMLCGQPVRDNATATRLLFTRNVEEQPVALPSRQASRFVIDHDLDAICIKALAFNPAQRYANAAELAADLDNWQLRRPVSARTLSRRYRLARFTSRNRWGVAAAMVMLSIGIAGIVATLWQAQQAHEQAERAVAQSQRAQVTRDFLVQLFEANDPDIAQGQMPTARDLLDLGAHQIQQAFTETPQLRAEMLALLGGLYRSLGEYQSARPLLEESLELAQGTDDLNILVDALHAIGRLELDSGRHLEAMATLTRAESLLESAGWIPGPRHAAMMESLATAYGQVGRFDDAIMHGETMLARARAVSGLPDQALFDYLVALAGARLNAQQPVGAADLLKEAMALDIPNQPSREMTVHWTLQHVLGRIGGDETASEMHAREVLALAERIYPPKHFRRARALHDLTWPLMMSGRLDEAMATMQRGLDIYNAIYPDGRHPDVAAAHNALGVALFHAERFDKAEEHVRTARSLVEELLGREHQRYASTTQNLGQIRHALGDFRQAEVLLTEARDIRRRALGPDHPFVGRSSRLLGVLRLDQDRPAEALTLADEALATYAHAATPAAREEPRFLVPAMTLRARALHRLGRAEEAEAVFAEAIALGESATRSAELEWPELLVAHAEFIAEHRPADASAAYSRAHTALDDFYGSDHPATRRIGALAASTSDHLESGALTPP